MTCPRCHSEFRRAELENTDGMCPECGVRLLHNVSGVMKTSAVMIAARGESGFYRSVQDVPEPLRTQLIETTTSPNSGIIVIADKAGKEQLTQVLARREAGREAGQPAADTKDEAVVSKPEDLSPITRLPWLAWAGFIVVLILSAILFALFRGDWAAFSFHW
jgi:DNA-directed RNA polymerase subunit RPC12/RpoP